MIIVTPYLVKPMDPIEETAHADRQAPPASAVDYFLGNVEENKAREKRARLPSRADCARRRRPPDISSILPKE